MTRTLFLTALLTLPLAGGAMACSRGVTASNEPPPAACSLPAGQAPAEEAAHDSNVCVMPLNG